MRETRVLVLGPQGHGRWHLENIQRLHDKGLRLVGAYQHDPAAVERDNLIGDVPVEDDLPGLIRRTKPDIAVVSTPIHTHVPLALEAMKHGCAVLLEKPPAPTLADYEALVEGAAGVPCQVGFQSLGSAAIPAVQAAMARGDIGEVRGIGGAGTWVREDGYFHRSAWTGHRFIEGVPVVDGVLTNPFAHAVATAMRLTGADQKTGLASVEVDMYRAHDIESDDSSSLRLTTEDGIVITVAATLCPEVDREPRVVVHGSQGSITLWYTLDEVTIRNTEGETTRRYPRTELLENLAEHLADSSKPLLVPLGSMRPFMHVMQAVATSPDPRVIPDSMITVAGEGDTRRLIVQGIDDAIERSVTQLALFRELGLPWAGDDDGQQPTPTRAERTDEAP
jgi:predicted dehydrogenase